MQENHLLATSQPLVLASASPRRKELLSQLGYVFSIVHADIEEKQQDDEQAYDYVLRLSQQKAAEGLRHSAPDSLVLGSDTVVVCDGEVLEKPKDYSDSLRMLSMLSGRDHQVMTAVSIVSAKQQKSVVVTTDVWFKPLSEPEIHNYWLSGEPCDKAGSYGIQGLGGRFVTRIEGSYYAVVGLPLFETDQLLHEFL
ncbi:septum formation inhibitor Maf [Vibrio sp. 10N.286.49.B3]|uniref:Maf family protein n=1 Tax=Vibrio sp. 10N.286.49.B3 TaxID=1880855 RepID=UPI000C8356E7|nr:Maf family protein [Vibrio sp. 10N.286.49.B3]PMH39880.1 septum formation inhibitor Maf [Vibrio sp. 10N.286.49.B3]